MPRVTASPNNASRRLISGRRHPLVDEYRRLGRRRRPDDPLILLDGLHLVQDARRARLRIRSAAFSTASLTDPATAAEAAELMAAGTDVVEVPTSIAALLSPVRMPSGVVAIAERPMTDLEPTLDATPALIVIAVDVQDPGNLGALVRACEAGGATGVLAAGSSADPFSWKALRGAMGSALRLPVVSGLSGADAIQACKRRRFQVVAAGAHGGRSLFEVDWTRPTAIVVGNEGSGLSTALLHEADVLVTIPMQPPVESLNVGVATALLVYEARRQRSERRA